MPKFLLPSASASASRLPVLSLDEAANADQRRFYKSAQRFQQPTPNPSPSPETPLHSLPVLDSKFELEPLTSSEAIAFPPSPSSTICSVSVSAPSKRIHAARRPGGSAQRPPRPRNAFILYRSDVIASGRINTNQQNEASAIAGKMWKMEDSVTKERYQTLAAEEKARHALLYPDYKYSPGTKKATAFTPTVKPSPSVFRARTSTKRQRAADDDEAEWGESASARPARVVQQSKKPRLSLNIPTPDPSPEPAPSPSPEPESAEEDALPEQLTLPVADAFDIDIPEFNAESPLTDDVDASVSDNTMFANFFASHQNLMEAYPIVLPNFDSQPTFSYPFTFCQPIVPPMHRIPCLDGASFAAYKPLSSFVDRCPTPIKPVHTYPRRVPDTTAQEASFSLHVSDEMLFKDFLSADALQPMDVFEADTRPICALPEMDTKYLAKELDQIPLF